MSVLITQKEKRKKRLRGWVPQTYYRDFVTYLVGGTSKMEQEQEKQNKMYEIMNDLEVYELAKA